MFSKKFPIYRISTTIIVALVSCFTFVACGSKPKTSSDDTTGRIDFSKSYYIAHAMGAIDGITYTSTLEAFEYNYAKGYRVFEADFLLSEENELICIHEGDFGRLGDDMTQYNPAGKPPLDLFKSKKVLDKYTTLDIDDIVTLMDKYPDWYLVTDTKFTDAANIGLQFQNFVDRVPAKYMSRIIPQVYNFAMYDQIEAIYPWQDVILTLYMLNIPDSDIIANLGNCENIRAITMEESRANPTFVAQLTAMNLPIYVHTINDEQKWSDLQARGIHGIYTDTIFHEE